MQSRDNAVADDMTLTPVTRRAPTEAEMRDLIFAFRVAKHVKSNTIVYAKDGATVGIGAGQMSRIDFRAHRRAQGAGCGEGAGPQGAADPGLGGGVGCILSFRRWITVAIEAGATAVIQPGGSMRDDEVIKAADDASIAMVFTGVRHFRH